MSDKIREQFEAWASTRRYRFELNADGSYYDSCTYHAWQAWQASRTALVVELPEKWPLFTVDEVKDILDLAGVKYK